MFDQQTLYLPQLDCLSTVHCQIVIIHDVQGSVYLAPDTPTGNRGAQCSYKQTKTMQKGVTPFCMVSAEYLSTRSGWGSNLNDFQPVKSTCRSSCPSAQRKFCPGKRLNPSHSASLPSAPPVLHPLPSIFPSEWSNPLVHMSSPPPACARMCVRVRVRLRMCLTKVF